MNAIFVNRYGGPEVLELREVDPPVPSEREALVRVRAVGVNFADIASRSGRYRPALPWIPGNEAAGEVVAVRENELGIVPGSRVAWITTPAGLALRYANNADGLETSDTVASTYAELAVVPIDQLIPLPDELSFLDAVAIAMQGITAHYLAYSAYPIKAGDTVLIHAGAGGVGYLLIQLAKLLGARVITTVSSDAKAAFCNELGADHVVNYTTSNFLDEVMLITNGQGVAAVYDSVGATTFEMSLESLGLRGYLLLYGQSSGNVPPFTLSRLNEGSWFVSRPSLGHYIHTRQELLFRANEMFSLLLEGVVRVHIHSVLPLGDAARAHSIVESRESIGKVALEP